MRIKLQGRTPYQDSLRHTLNARFFKEQGIQAFIQGYVPYNITSNHVFAEQMASMIVNQLQTISLESNGPIRILELGGGLGIFALNFLQAFETQCTQKGLPYVSQLEYWLTDFAPRALKELATYSPFQKQIQAGRLKLFIIDSLQPNQVTHLDGTVTALSEPCFHAVIANYHFDNLPTAIWHYRDEAFQELEIELYGWLVGSPDHPPDFHARRAFLQQTAEQLKNLRIQCDDVPVSPGILSLLRQAREEIIEKLRWPIVARQWDPAFDFRACLGEWFFEASLKYQTTVMPEVIHTDLEKAIEILILDPLLPRPEDFSQSELQEVHFKRPVDLKLACLDQPMEDMVQSLVMTHQETRFTYPVMVHRALSILQFLLQPGGVFLITDKGYHDLNFPEPGRSVISIHGQSIAMPLNFPYLERWFKAQGGACIWTQDPDSDIQTLMAVQETEIPPETQALFDAQFIQNNLNLQSHMLLKQGIEAFKAAKYETAINRFLQALEKRPQGATIIYQLLVTYLTLKRPQAVLAYKDHVLDDFFMEPKFQVLWADAHRLLGAFSQAKSHYLQALKHATAHGLPTGMLYCQLGICCLKLGDHDAGRDYFEAAIPFANEHPQIKQVLDRMLPRLKPRSLQLSN